MKIILLVVLGCFALLLTGCAGARKTEKPGLRHGQLRPCPDAPNCVSSTATVAARQVSPFELQVAPAAAWVALQKTIPELPRTQIISVTDNYIHAECRSAVFGFIDDLELQLQPDKQQIAVRSAARLGHYDFGVNHKRVEELRRKLRAAGVVR